MRFRPCIDLHDGRVKQIVGSTLTDDADAAPITNFASEQPPEFYADMYWRDGLTGGHVIMLGPRNETAAAAAVGIHPDSLQVGGGITPSNAAAWLERGAAKVIVTSFLFKDGRLQVDRLRELTDAVPKERLVMDLSCRRRGDAYLVVCDRWQTFTETDVSRDALGFLADFCSEFLIHGVDVEGKQAGVDAELIELLAAAAPVPITYAGGISSMADVRLVETLGGGTVDITVGSALDIFGGSGLRYADLVALDRAARG